MKKLIALFAASTVASTAAVAGVALSGTASVTYDADLLFTGTNGGTTVTVGQDVNGGSPVTTSAALTSSIGMLTVTADMFDETSSVAATNTAGGQIEESTDTSVTVSLDIPVGDMTVGLDNSGNVILSGTFSGVTVSHTVGDTTSTTASAAIAGIDMSVTNKAGATTWSLDTTVSGVDLTLTSGQKITAAFGLAGNTMTVTRNPSVAAVASSAGNAAGTHANGYGAYAVSSVASYSTVAISRDLTSGATLSATYSTKDDSLTLKAAVTF